MRKTMASPPIPPQLDDMATRPFSVYPAIVGIRTASPTDRRVFKLIGVAVLAAILLYVLAVNLSRQRVVFTARDQTYLGLTARDDRTAIVGKLGEPASDHWRADTGEIQF